MIGNSADPEFIDLAWHRDRRAENKVAHLPNAALVFPELLEVPEKEDDLSCAELLQLNQQHLLINQQMSLIAGQYLYKLLMCEAIYSRSLRYFPPDVFAVM